MAHHVPGEEFYQASLERARALPEAERSADVAAWLRSHDAIEAAAAALPEMPLDGSMLTRPAGGPAALAALLQVLAHSFAVPPADPKHPCTRLRCLGPQLPPLMHLFAHGVDIQMAPQPRLLSILQGGGSGRQQGDELDLEMVARLLLLVWVTQLPGFRFTQVAADALAALKPALLGDAAAARLDRQIAELRQKVADGSSGSSSSGSGTRSTSGASSSSSSGSAPELPSARQLQIVWHALSLEVAASDAAPKQLPPAAVSRMAEQAARGLLQLEPDNPRSSCAMGKVAVMNHDLNPSSSLRDPLPHLLRCVELAREQRSDFFLTRGSWWAVMVAASDSNPLLSPAQAAGLWDEAAAAFQRCKRVLPPSWASMVRAERDMCAAIRPTLDAHLAASPQRWRGAIRAQQLGEVRQKAQHMQDKHPVGQLPTCDGCGLPSSALKCCSRCKARRYCSKACQAQDWKEGGHKQECPQLAAARGAGGGAHA